MFLWRGYFPISRHIEVLAPDVFGSLTYYGLFFNYISYNYNCQGIFLRSLIIFSS